MGTQGSPLLFQRSTRTAQDHQQEERTRLRLKRLVSQPVAPLHHRTRANNLRSRRPRHQTPPPPPTPTQPSQACQASTTSQSYSDLIISSYNQFTASTFHSIKQK